MSMKLVHTPSGIDAKIGELFTDFRGDIHKLEAAYEPGTSQGGRGEGKVRTNRGIYYVSVINCHFVNE